MIMKATIAVTTMIPKNLKLCLFQIPFHMGKLQSILCEIGGSNQ